MSCQDIAQKIGQHLLFLGVNTQGWGDAQFQEAAQFAKAHGIDSLLIKCADGGNWWYGGLGGYQRIRDLIKAVGVGVVPYTYSYGNTYNYLDGEIDILIALMQSDGVVCADMETEWNGQVGWAGHLTSRIQGQSGLFLVSTWADPSLQNWAGVIQSLNPCVDCYLPQQYSNYLAALWGQFGDNGAACLQPTVAIQGVDTNDPVAIAKAAHDQGHTSLSIWYHDDATANPGLLDQILAAFPKTGGTQSMALLIPSGWKDDGSTLTAPNGISVRLGFRDHVMTNNWNADNYPMEAEVHCDPLEYSNPKLGAGQRQRFRWITLEYPESTGVVIEAWTGPELLWYQQQLSGNTVAQENTALKAKIAQAVKDLQ